jgi:hypothetical protein
MPDIQGNSSEPVTGNSDFYKLVGSLYIRGQSNVHTQYCFYQNVNQVYSSQAEVKDESVIRLDRALAGMWLLCCTSAPQAI